MKRAVLQFAADESGTTAIEYGLIAALVSIVVISSVSAVGSALVGNFFQIAVAAFK